MRILVLEPNTYTQKTISQLLNGVKLSYEPTVTRAINRLGLEQIDFALINVDYKKAAYSWEVLASFLNKMKIDFSIFSSSGKIEIANGHKVIPILDLPNQIPQLTSRSHHLQDHLHPIQDEDLNQTLQAFPLLKKEDSLLPHPIQN